MCSKDFIPLQVSLLGRHLHFLSNTSVTSKTTSPTSGDKTNLLTSRCVSLDSGSVTDMLMITTTMGMLYGIHSNTTNLGPGVPLGLVLMVSTSSLQEGLFSSTTTGNDTNRSTRGGRDNFLSTRGKTDSGLSGIWVVTDDCGVVSRGSGKGTTISHLLLDIADEGTFGDASNREDISDAELSFLTTVDELSGVHTLSGNEKFGLLAEFGWVAELDTSKRSTTARIVNDFFHESLDVAVPLAEVERAVFGGPFSVLRVRPKDTAGTLPLT